MNAIVTPILAADIGASVTIGQPGFYGRLDIRDYPQPVVIYRQPVVTGQVPNDRPLGLHAGAPGHAKYWAKHCRTYNACGERVFFVQNSWYDRQYVPPVLKIRAVNVVDLMKLQPQREHPHGLSDTDFDALFTMDKPVIFAFHGYPWLIHRLTCRRTNHDNFHVRGYKEEGTITTPFDMTVLNDLDRFHLVMDTIDRQPQTGDPGMYLKQHLKDKLIEHKQYIDNHGRDLPEIRNWKWNGSHQSIPPNPLLGA